MQIYCEKCRSPQRNAERTCSTCGAHFGGQLSVLIIGVLLALFLPVILVSSGNRQAVVDARLLFWYELPVLIGTAFLYDYHPLRRNFYFWGGAVVIAGSLIVLAS